MNFPGSISVAPLDPALRQDLVLRPFQRITAEVVQVSNTQAILSVDGFPVVAMLSSLEQAAALREQRVAQFVVSQMDGQTVVLRFIRPGTAEAQAQAGQVDTTRLDLATRLLEEIGQPVTSENLTLVRAALGQRLQVTPELFKELSSVLSSLGNWTEGDAALAAAIKAAGLPLTQASLQLAGKPGEQVGDAMARLTVLLQQTAQEPDLPETLRAALQQGLLLLDDASVDWNQPAGAMADKLKTAVEFLGRSFENVLKEQVQGNSPFWPDKTLVQIARLQDLFRAHGRTELSDALGKFMEDVRQNQMMNARNDLQAVKNGFTDLSMLLRVPDKAQDPEYYPTRLRISRQPGSGKGKYDPAFTHLAIQVDLEGGHSMQVDLTLTGKQVKADVTAPTVELGQEAEKELPSLSEALDALGFALKDTAVSVGEPPPFENIDVHPGAGSGLMSVDVEV
jgi:hypothetical protein